MHLYAKDRRVKGVETQMTKRAKVCVCFYLSVCLRTRGKERDGVQESASQRGRKRQREGN